VQLELLVICNTYVILISILQFVSARKASKDHIFLAAEVVRDIDITNDVR